MRYRIAVTIDNETRYQSMTGQNGWTTNPARAIPCLSREEAERHAATLERDMPGAMTEIQPIAED